MNILAGFSIHLFGPSNLSLLLNFRGIQRLGDIPWKVSYKITFLLLVSSKLNDKLKMHPFIL